MSSLRTGARIGIAAVVLSTTSAVAQPAPEAPPDGDAAAEPAPADAAPADERPDEPPPDETPGPDDARPAAPASIDHRAPPPPPPAPAEPTSFSFGSYGRILVGTDLRGGSPRPVAVVAHGPRVVEPSYLELDLAYAFRAPSGARLRTVTTLAFFDELFHYTGVRDAEPALRNLYLEAALDRGVSGWVGARMVRGDDIYLLDYWPLDDQNTVGAGARYTAGDLDVAGHVGVNRLLDDYQYQEVDVADPEQGATTIVQLDRQRFVASASATYQHLVVPALDVHGKLKLHGELHALPEGERRRGDDTLESLPSDWGTTLGLEVGAWQPSARGYRRHANLFARWSKGLAAFDELAAPVGFDAERKVFPKASEIVLGLSAGFDHALGNVLLGGYSRRFVDADPSSADRDDGWEYVVAARPLARVAGDLYAGGDVSYQVRFPRGLDPTSQLASDPAIVQLAPMLVYSPMGGSAYDRPQLRLVYSAAHQNQGALDRFAPDDPRRGDAWVYFLGAQAEWWFNSTYR